MAPAQAPKAPQWLRPPGQAAALSSSALGRPATGSGLSSLFNMSHPNTLPIRADVRGLARRGRGGGGTETKSKPRGAFHS